MQYHRTDSFKNFLPSKSQVLHRRGTERIFPDSPDRSTDCCLSIKHCDSISLHVTMDFLPAEGHVYQRRGGKESISPDDPDITAVDKSEIELLNYYFS